MPKKKKLSFDSLKITSFVTSLDKETENQAKGGVTLNGPLCSVEICDTSICSRTHCDGFCPQGMAPSVWPCQSVDMGCYIDTEEPCTSISIPFCGG